MHFLCSNHLYIMHKKYDQTKEYELHISVQQFRHYYSRQKCLLKNVHFKSIVSSSLLSRRYLHKTLSFTKYLKTISSCLKLQLTNRSNKINLSKIQLHGQIITNTNYELIIKRHRLLVTFNSIKKVHYFHILEEYFHNNFLKCMDTIYCS